MSFRTNNDPMSFDTPALENANMTILHCREVLEKTGLVGEARRLDGIEVTDKETATAALEVLNSMRVKAEAVMQKLTTAKMMEAEEAHRIAVTNVQDALVAVDPKQLRS